MAYVSDSNLTQFWGLAKGYIKAEDSRYANWQKTEKAGAVTCWPVGGTELKPTVDFLFSETGPASGDKGPENPSTITGVSSVKVTRCGKNLVWTPWQDATTVTRDGITWTVNGDGTVTASGTATADSYFNVRASTAGNRQHLDSGLTYVLSGCPASGSNATYLLAFVCNSATFKDIGAGTTCSVNADDSGWISCIVRSGVTVSNQVFRPQLELGTTATSFEPYDGTDYTIDLASTFYGGSIDLATGLMTVTWEAFSLNGTENWTFGGETATTGVYIYSLKYGFVADGGSTGNGGVCSHFVYDDGAGATQIVSWHHSKNYLYIYSDISDLDDFKTWLSSQVSADTPVTICDKKVTPFESPLAPTQILSLTQTDKFTLRLNTIHTDAQAIQVGYAKSPIRSEYELTQAIIATEGGE